MNRSLLPPGSLPTAEWRSAPEWPDGRPGAAVDRPRLAGLALVVAGVVHLLVPDRLLGTARVAYRLGLRVRFRPRPGARRRVRLVGVGMVLAGAHILYHGGVRPGRD